MYQKVQPFGHYARYTDVVSKPQNTTKQDTLDDVAPKRQADKPKPLSEFLADLKASPMSNNALMLAITSMMHVYLVEERYKDHLDSEQP